MSQVRFYFLGLPLFALLASSVAAQIYRWVDDKGTVHFTDERPRDRPGVKEVVEAGARRTPMVRGGPEWRVDTPIPDSFDRTGRRDDDYDDDYYYDDEYYYDDDYGDQVDYGYPQQGDTVIYVYEPPLYFDQHKHPRHHDRKRDGDHGRHDRSREGDHGRGDRHREPPRPPSLAPPPRADQVPAPAGRPGRAASRAVPLR